jgi:hypothetical protein
LFIDEFLSPSLETGKNSQHSFSLGDDGMGLIARRDGWLGLKGMGVKEEEEEKKVSRTMEVRVLFCVEKENNRVSLNPEPITFFILLALVRLRPSLPCDS